MADLKDLISAAPGASMDNDTEHTTGEGIVAIIERAGRYLMIRRPDDIRAGGYWCFVGGAIEDGESQEQALVREVYEEVALEVAPGEKVWECLSIYKEWVLHCWTVRDSGGEVQAEPREVAEFRWLTVAEIMRLPKLMPSVPEFFRHRGLL
ncbi:MAG: NUDIX domain-containing protein [Planctomycetes bacterium]|nr:NUDIX domain-containing protein [Planctomycetota bacterium]